MSNISCDACNNLREYAPHFIQNGVDATVAASLKNNMGLNSAVVVNHRNCEDLNDVNDCLIGRMVDELEAYDVCDWKDFNNKYLSNLYETLKALIASDCGQWLRIESLCAILQQLIRPSLQLYGVLPHTYGDQHPENRGGQLEGGWVYERIPTSEEAQGSTWRSSCVGLRLGFLNALSCDGAPIRYLWYSPVFINHILRSDTPPGSIIWSVDKQTALSWGLTEGFWQTYTVSSWAWNYGFVALQGYSGFNFVPIRIQLRVDPDTDRLVLRYYGSVVGVPIPANAEIMTDDGTERITAI